MMSDYRELLLGCGHSRVKRIPTVEGGREWHNLVTLDLNPDTKPDVLTNLDTLNSWVIENMSMDEIHECLDPIGFVCGTDLVKTIWSHIKDDYFDEVHAYEVLEHLGQQGDFKSFFSHFSEIWRILKPGGLLCATCPSRFSEGLWGDPGHRRVITGMSLIFLDQEQYNRQCDRSNPTPMSDYRSVYKSDFMIVDAYDDRRTFSFKLRAVKPSRISASK